MLRTDGFVNPDVGVLLAPAARDAWSQSRAPSPVIPTRPTRIRGSGC